MTDEKAAPKPKTETVTLKGPVRHRGKTIAEGKTLSVSARRAAWLRERGKA